MKSLHRGILALAWLGCLVFGHPTSRASSPAGTNPTGAPATLPPVDQRFAQSSTKADYSTDHLLVRFAPAILAADRSRFLEGLGGAEVSRVFTLVPGLCVVELPTATSVADALLRLNSTAGILYAEPDYQVHALSTFPNDARFGELWGLHNTGQTGGTADADIDAPEAWDLGTGDLPTLVAVIDTGVDYTHPDLAENIWTNPGEIPGNGIDDDGNGYVDDVHGYDFVHGHGNPLDDNDHGTHCAGTIGAQGNNGFGIAGVCWKANLLAIKTLDETGNGTTANAILAVQYATRMGARVANNSWGGGAYSQSLKDAIDAAGAAGCLFIAAAGNDYGNNNDTNSYYPASYGCSNVIAVMSSDQEDERSTFSNYGPTTVDLAAPGTAILGCQPGGSYQLKSGTSMAAPYVAGACSLLLSANPALTVAEVKQALLSTVDPTLPGQCASGGRLNLARALAAVTTDTLQVLPTNGFTSSGAQGGGFFVPDQTIYTLTNLAAAALPWEIIHTQTWLSLSASGGTLPAHAAVSVIGTLTSAAASLPPGVYLDSLVFSNANSGVVQRREAALTVVLPRLSIADTSVLEGNAGLACAVFQLSLAPATRQTVTVSYCTADGTALAGSDYLATNGTVTFAAGETNHAILVPVPGDTVAEANETFSVVLSNPVGAGLERASATGTIVNDEPSPFVYVRSAAGAPWGSVANETALNRVFGETNWQDLRYETLSPAALFSPTNRFLYLEGSDTGASEFQSFLESNLNAMQDWVAAGGRLFLNAAPNEGSQMSLGFGITLNYPDSAADGLAVNPLHPLCQGPFLPVGTAWSGASFAHASLSGPGLAPIIISPTTTRIVLGELACGQGLVLFGGLTTPNFQSPAAEAANLRADLLYYTAFTPSNPLRSSPADGWSASGYTGGPFAPANKSYTLSNCGASNLEWKIVSPANWVTPSPGGGWLAAGAMTNVTLALNANADSLLGGDHTATVIFSNLTAAAGSARPVRVDVLPRVFDRLAWSPIASPQYAGQPFAATVSAQDLTGQVLTSVNGCLALSAQCPRTNFVGLATNTTSFPLGALWQNERTQIIYPAASLGSAARLFALALDVATLPGQTLSHWTIRLKHTPLASYTVNLWETNDWSTVYHTNLSITSTGWNTFYFATPFDYNGTDSLMVDLSFNNSAWASSGFCRATTDGTHRTIYFYTDSAYGDPLAWSGAVPSPFTSRYCPNLRLFSSTLVNIAPGVACLSDGAWSGVITASGPATNLVLHALDSNGYESISDPFDVLPGIFSRPLVQAISVTASNVTLSWTAVPGENYWLQSCPGPGDTNWTTLVGPITATGLTLTQTVTGARQTQRFYRVLLPRN